MKLESLNVKLTIKKLCLYLVLAFIMLNSVCLTSIYALYNPTSVPNNKYGIHLIAPTPDESKPAADLVNNAGDWGYITILIESNNRDHDKWQTFFNDLRRRHLIPIVRIATQPDPSGFWKKPYDGEEKAWADFLDKLVWPTKNRYVIIYNEPNHGTEWGNSVDAADYARTLDKTITALKNKNSDFFVMNAGFDASTPNEPPRYLDEESFMRQMNDTVPGIFNRLDGWSSHSYPNPNFSSSPANSGKGSVRTFEWEMDLLKSLGVNKNLPIFITETGWKHSEGLKTNNSYPNAETVSEYYKNAFENAWNNPQIVAVTPFLLTYQEEPFAHFSFKKPTGEKQDTQILGAQYPEYYPQYQTLRNVPKVKGRPIQEKKAQIVKGTIYNSIVAGETYNITLTIKNTGQSIWNEYGSIKLAPTEGAMSLSLPTLTLPENVKIEPGQTYDFNFQIKAPQGGNFDTTLTMYEGTRIFDSKPFEFTTAVKSPVSLIVKASLKWKDEANGDYMLSAISRFMNTVVEASTKVTLGIKGTSKETEVRSLLPDYTYDFTLEKPFYQPKTIRQTVHEGVNTLDFGELKPDIPSAILHPMVMWNLLPWSN